jgi:hypothetical protein
MAGTVDKVVPNIVLIKDEVQVFLFQANHWKNPCGDFALYWRLRGLQNRDTL